MEQQHVAADTICGIDKPHAAQKEPIRFHPSKRKGRDHLWFACQFVES